MIKLVLCFLIPKLLLFETISVLKQMLLTLWLNNREVIDLTNILSYEKIFLSASLLILFSPIFAHEIVFEVCFVCKLLNHIRSVFYSPCFWEISSDVGLTACYWKQREIYMFIIETIFSHHWHSNGTSWVINFLVTIFFCRLSIRVSARKVSRKLDFSSDHTRLFPLSRAPCVVSSTGLYILALAIGEIDLTWGQHILRNYFIIHVGVRNDINNLGTLWL